MPGISDHDTVFVELDLSPVTHTQTPRKIPLYKKARWDSMKEDMATLHQTIKSMAENNTDINTIWDKFTTTLKTSIQQHIAHKTARPRETSPWIDKSIKRLIRKRDRLDKKMKKSQDKQHQRNYKNCKHLVQKKLRQAYWTYVDNIVTPQPSDPNIHSSQKRFWTFIKHKKKDNQTITGLKRHGQLHSDPKSKANILNRQFKSVFTDYIKITADDFKKGDYVNPQSTHPVVPEISITTNGITKLLLALNPH